ncbi:MAG: hypothetical protein AAF945_21290 [Actinomycetota bacterium]
MPRRRVTHPAADVPPASATEPFEVIEVIDDGSALGDVAGHDRPNSGPAVLIVRSVSRLVGASGTVSGRLGWAAARIVGRSTWRVTRAAASGAQRRPQVAAGVLVGAALVVGVIVIVRSKGSAELDETPERSLRSVA